MHKLTTPRSTAFPSHESTAKLESLNALRGLAALLVALDHTILLGSRPTPDSGLFQVATFMGAFGVGAFFLLSGFVIFISLERTPPARFLLQRVFRLYPVIITAVALRLVSQLALDMRACDAETLGIFLLNISLFGNLFMGIEKNIEPIVWTLNIEVKFYLLMALVFTVAGRRPQARMFPLLTLMACLLGWCASRFPRWIVKYAPPVETTADLQLAVSCLPVLFLGTVACLAYRRTLTPSRIWTLAGLFLVVLFFAPEAGITTRKNLAAWTVALVLFLACVYSPVLRSRLDKAWLRWLGAISYPLYAVHSTVIEFLVHAMPSMPTAAVMAGSMVLTLATAHAMHRWIEDPIHQWSRRRFAAPGRRS
ncbi:MAG TPA: acyltransferase [Candidatus Aquabacterium excrementipullorum]|nr:acyltransferase [Candidatus Aquabacterium excrementipullorum]